MRSKSVFLLQLLLWLSIILTSGMPIAHAAATASTQEIQAVQSLEDTLFAVHYDQDSLNDRVNRLEETVFGQTQSGTSIDARITKLQGSLSPKALGPLSSKTASAPAGANMAKSLPNQPNAKPGNPNTGMPVQAPQQIASNNGTSTNGMGHLNRSTGNGAAKAAPSSVASSPEPGETDYPTVTQMEQKTFGKTFVKEDITQRLNRLETQVFKTQQTGSLADRTDNLRLVVLGDTGNQAQPTANANYGDPYSNGPNGGYSQPDPQTSNAGYGYPQPPNYGGYGNNGGSAPYGGPPQSAYGGHGYNLPANYGGLPNNIAAAGGGYSNGNMNPMPGYGNTGNTPVSYQQPHDSTNGAVTPDMMAAMNEVEKEVLGTTHPSEPMNERLDRVENKVFKTTSPEMSPQDRIQRVIAVASAGGAPPTGKQKAKATFQVLLPIILTILPLVLL